MRFWSSKLARNKYRGTLFGDGLRLMDENGLVDNLWGGALKKRFYDGVKMDIEGSEFGLIDSWLLPRCNKLCFEYHTSRDKSMDNLKRRVAILRSRFEIVNYVPELDRIMKKGGQQKSFHDRVIYCKNPKRKP